MPKVYNALSVYDFTLSCKYCDDHKIICNELEQFCKKWGFQKEKGSNSGKYIHENIEDFSDEDDEYESENNEDDFNFDDFEDEDTNMIIDGYKSLNSIQTMEDADETDDEYSDENLSTIDEEGSEYSSDSSDSYDSDESVDENGEYIHFQGKISLMTRKRPNELFALLKANDFILQKAHFSPSSNNGLGEIFYEKYITKCDTRIDGAWTNKNYEKEKPIPFYLRNVKLYQWQKSLLERAKWNKSMRRISVVYCPKGNTGKSFCCNYACCVNKNAILVPPIMNSFLDLNQSVLSQVKNRPDPEILFIDIPRSMPKNKMNDLISFAEQAKLYCFDTRYKYEGRYWLNPTEVIIFTNVKFFEKEGSDLLSNDRWTIYKITDDRRLILYNGDEPEPINYPDEYDDKIRNLFNKYIEFDNNNKLYTKLYKLIINYINFCENFESDNVIITPHSAFVSNEANSDWPTFN